jgi:hypothetical protein
MGRIGAAGTFGGMIGGGLIERTSHWLGTASTMWVLSGACAVAGLLVSVLARGKVPPPQQAPQEDGGESSRYLLGIAGLVFCTALVSTFADFALKQAAATRYTEAASLVRFFALFYAATSVVGFLLQVLLARHVLEVAGVGATLAVAPLSVLVFGAAAIMAPTLIPIAALKGSESALTSSLYRSAYEPLFAPIPPALKRAKKALLDVACDKGGEVAGALTVLVLVASATNQLARIAIGLAATAAVAAVYLCFRAQRGYVSALEGSLRSGALSADSVELADPMTRLTLSGTAIGLDRARLLEYIAQFQTSESIVMPPQQVDRLLRDLRALVEGDVVAARQLLQRLDLDPRLAAFVVPLLAVNGLARGATDALRTMGRPAIALMGDVMRNSEAQLVVRRRIPQVLRTVTNKTAIDALSGALDADQFVVRSRAALALREVLQQSDVKHPEPECLLKAALREAAVEPLGPEACEHMLLLLTLGTGLESIELVRQAMRSPDDKLRGTAIEYLESLLPEGLRSSIIAALTRVVPLQRGTPRAATELGDELKRSVVDAQASPDWSESLE